MRLPKFKLLEPKTLRQASRLLREQGDQAIVIAGGTDLLQSLKNRLKSPGVLVDLNGIPCLDQISFSKKAGLRIGALVTLRQLANDPITRARYPVLAQAARQVGSPQLQAMGTVGGNLSQDNLCIYYNRSPMMRLTLAPCLKLGGDICHAVSGSDKCWAVYSGDLAPVLLTLRASLVVCGPEGTRTIRLDELYSHDGKQPNTLAPGQILKEIRVPLPSQNAANVYLKMRLRQTIDYPLLGVALRLELENGSRVCRDVALALTGVDKAPLLIQDTDRLKGTVVDSEFIAALAANAHRQAHPLGNVVEVTPKYRRDMIDIYVKQAVGKALGIEPV